MLSFVRTLRRCQWHYVEGWETVRLNRRGDCPKAHEHVERF